MANKLDKVGLSINEAAAAIGISRAALYPLLREDRGPETVKVGARTLVVAETLVNWLAKQRAFKPSNPASTSI